MTSSSVLQYSTYETDDFEDLQEAASKWDQEYMQLSPGKFAGSLEMTEVGSTQIMREKWGKKVRYRGVGVPNGFGFAMPLGETNSVNWLGSPVGPTSVVMQSPYFEGQLISDETWDSLVFSFDEDEVRDIIIALSGGRDRSRELHGNLVLGAQSAKRLKRAGLEIIKISGSSDIDDHSRIARHADQFKKKFIWELLEALDASRKPLWPTSRADIVRRATDLVFSDPTRSVGLTELCRQLGVSLRSLHYAFQDVTGMSPATWLRRIRLNQVRRVLRYSEPNATRIKTIASEYGFAHLGHFCDQYQRLFGDLPSQTLRPN